jgi:hypothetical protein
VKRQYEIAYVAFITMKRAIKTQRIIVFHTENKSEMLFFYVAGRDNEQIAVQASAFMCISP